MVTLAQVGIGVWGRNLLRNFASLIDCRVKICCDKDREVLNNIKIEYSNKIEATENFQDLIDDNEVDAVAIATLPVTHTKLAIQALSAGKHIFVEKPLALKIEDGYKIIEVARKNNKIVMVGHILLYHPAVVQLKEYIKQSLLGDVYYIYSTRVNLGQVREEENALWSLTAHDISVVLHLLEREPIEVVASGRSYLRDNVQDVVFVALNFNNKIMAHIHASWLDPHKIRKFTVVGSKKMAVFDDMESSEKIRLYDKGFDRKKRYGSYETFLTIREGDINIPKIQMVEPLKLECRHFIDCIKNNKKPLSDGQNGLSVLKVLTAAQKSLEENGKPTKIL